ncbi:MAG: hypothetical protein DHS20C18_33420 [Saprospiraceae bacterium]|nr:MAG: hypothetical protein DHS20C18_33420 [Saprospiraceae bacterium]
MKFLKSIILAFVVMAATANFANAQSASTDQATSTEQTAENIKTLTVKVKGVGCSSDLKSISANVKKLEGVNSCESVKMGATSSFEVSYNSALVTEKQIHAAIEGTGGCQNPNDRPYKVKI